MSGAALPQRAMSWPRPARLPAAEGAIDWTVWGMTAFSMGCYYLAIKFGNLLMACFLATWMLYALARPARRAEELVRTLLPWGFPLLALASTLWSQAPAESFRNAAEMLLVTGIGILIAGAQDARSFCSAFMVAMVASVVLGALTGGTETVRVAGEVALNGGFGSKNYFAMTISLMMQACAAVLLDPRQPRPLRIIGALGLLIGPPLLLKARSLGAIVTFCIALGASLLIILAGRMPPRHRPALLLGALAAVLGAVGILGLLRSSGVLEQMLLSAGKDTTLTGRTYLWSRADWLITLKPALGYGYQAFWVQETVEAEGLWRYSLVPSRAGFNFHNLYYETVIELGYAGVAVLGATLAATAGAALLAALRRPCPSHAFLFGVVITLASRAYVEVDFLTPFSFGTIVVPLLWTFCRRGAAMAPARRP